MRRSQNGLARRRENRRGVVCSLTELETECSWEEGAASVTSFLRSFVFLLFVRFICQGSTSEGQE